MNGYEIIEEALFRLTGDTSTKPNTLFVGADVTVQYLLFWTIYFDDSSEGEEDKKNMIDRVSDLGVVYVGKFEAFGIPIHLLDTTK